MLVLYSVGRICFHTSCTSFNLTWCESICDSFTELDWYLLFQFKDQPTCSGIPLFLPFRESKHRHFSLRRCQHILVLKCAAEGCRNAHGLPGFSPAPRVHLPQGLRKSDHLPFLEQHGHLQQPENIPGVQQVWWEPHSPGDECNSGGEGGQCR